MTHDISMDGPLVLQNADLKQVIDLRAAVDSLEQMFSAYARGVAQNMNRYRIYTPVEEKAGAKMSVIGVPLDTRHHWFNLHAGTVPGSGYAALRVDSGIATIEEHYGTTRMEFPGQLVGIVLLYALEDGGLRAILSDHYVNPIRVSGTSALGVRTLAQLPVRHLGLFGTGWQARWHLSSCAAVLDELESVTIYSPNDERRKRFVEKQIERFPNLEIIEGADAEQTTRDKDAVVAATNALTPVFDSAWLKPGAHVVCIAGGDAWDKGTEIDPGVAARASRVVVNRLGAIEELDQRAITAAIEAGDLGLDDVESLGDVINGSAASREGDFTLHYNNEGMGMQFAAVGGAMYEAAAAKGLGTRLPYTWRGTNA